MAEAQQCATEGQRFTMHESVEKYNKKMLLVVELTI